MSATNYLIRKARKKMKKSAKKIAKCEVKLNRLKLLLAEEQAIKQAAAIERMGGVEA